MMRMTRGEMIVSLPLILKTVHYTLACYAIDRTNGTNLVDHQRTKNRERERTKKKDKDRRGWVPFRDLWDHPFNKNNH